ncbi:MAG TPA: sporulation integral membrane protein YtvI [Clostridiaceae bacterium]|nr:sporulation integral membrane protein YtvI [Clostridiaceae bacterium]
MDEHTISYKRIIKVSIAVLAVLVGVFTVYKLGILLAPFVISYILAMILEPLIRFLVHKAGISRKYSALIALLFFLLTVGVIIALIVIKLISEIKSFSTLLPKYATDIYYNIINFFNNNKELFNWLPKDIFTYAQDFISNFFNSLTSVANTLFKTVLSTAISIPEALLFAIVTIVSTFFIAKDKDIIHSFFKKQLPESWINKIISIKQDMFSALFGYIRAQLIIMVITFTELLIGFSIIRINYVLLLAIIISILDALPILGTGGVLIPWAIYQFLVGNYKLGISLFILYIVILIVRQLIEPKILGDQIGVYPLLTLGSMYIGMKLLGFAGLLLGPITFLLLKNIFSGMLKGRTFKETLYDKK